MKIKRNQLLCERKTHNTYKTAPFPPFIYSTLQKVLAFPISRQIQNKKRNRTLFGNEPYHIIIFFSFWNSPRAHIYQSKKYRDKFIFVFFCVSSFIVWLAQYSPIEIFLFCLWNISTVWALNKLFVYCPPGWVANICIYNK